jgi:hypothetical protein
MSVWPMLFIFRPGPSLVNRHKVNHSPCIFLVS